MSLVPFDARKVEKSSFVTELQLKVGKIYMKDEIQSPKGYLYQVNCILPSPSQITLVTSKPSFPVIKSSNANQ